MNPISFKGQNADLGKPPGWTDQQCRSLPVCRINFPDIGGACVSCWRMSLRERLKALFTGRIWITVVSGPTQPPICAAVDRPFKVVKDGNLKA